MMKLLAVTQASFQGLQKLTPQKVWYPKITQAINKDEVITIPKKVSKNKKQRDTFFF